jgi:predicted nuclease of predicted toxin-antitoxin system
MKFRVDALLPPGLCAVLQGAGHEAVHTSRLPARNRTTDRVISEVSLREQRVVVTKDTDSYHSHVLKRKPWKLLLVRTGNIRTGDLKLLFKRHMPEITAALARSSLVELDRQAVRIIV